MARSRPPRRSPADSRRRSPAVMAAATVLVVVAIVLPLIVPIYARTDPKWGDFPFFYWYLLISVPVVAILLVATNLLLRSKPTRDPAAAAGNGEVAK